MEEKIKEKMSEDIIKYLIGPYAMDLACKESIMESEKKLKTLFSMMEVLVHSPIFIYESDSYYIDYISMFLSDERETSRLINQVVGYNCEFSFHKNEKNIEFLFQGKLPLINCKSIQLKESILRNGIVNLEYLMREIFNFFCYLNNLRDGELINNLFDKFKQDPLNTNITCEIVSNKFTLPVHNLKYMQKKLIGLLNYKTTLGKHENIRIGRYISINNPSLLDFNKYGARQFSRFSSYYCDVIDKSVTYPDIVRVIYDLMVNSLFKKKEDEIRRLFIILIYADQNNINQLFNKDIKGFTLKFINGVRQHLHHY